MDGLERRSLSILQIGFPDFPRIAEELDAEAVGERLARLHELLTDPVLRLDGTALMYDQAVLLAVWSAPHPQPQHARLALQAAEVAMRASAAAVKGTGLRVRGGLVTGEGLVGIVDSRIRRAYGVFGKLREDAERLFWDAGHSRLAVSARTWQESGRAPYAGRPDPVVLPF